MNSSRGRYLIQTPKRGWAIGWHTVAKASTRKTAGRIMERTTRRPVRELDSHTNETVNYAIC